VAGDLCLSVNGTSAHVRFTGTELAEATVGSVRLKLLKVAAQVSVSVQAGLCATEQRVSRQEIFRLCHRRLRSFSLCGVISEPGHNL